MDTFRPRNASSHEGGHSPLNSTTPCASLAELIEELDDLQCAETSQELSLDINRLELHETQNVPVRQPPGGIHTEPSISTANHFTILEYEMQRSEPTTNPDPRRALLLEEKRLGYDPEELLHCAITCHPCRASNLSYAPKLSLFKQENFQDVPDHILTVIAPALALAERIILHGNPRLWIDIASGQREVDIAKSQALGGRVEHLHPAKDYSTAAISLTIDKLQRLGQMVWYTFEELPRLYGQCLAPNALPTICVGHKYLQRGEQWPSGIPLISYNFDADPWKQQTIIRLSSDFYTAAETFAKLKHPDVASLLRFNFFFAINLLHEIAHGFENKCGSANYRDEIARDRVKAAEKGVLAPTYLARFTEATYKHYPTEMGIALEYDTFGGRVSPVNDDLQMKYGLQVSLAGGRSAPWAGSRSAMEGHTPYGRAIPMGYIEELQQTSFWDEWVNDHGIVVPKYGPEAYLLCTCSTSSWREHLLESDPNYQSENRNADFVADLQDALPAAKRRKVMCEPPPRAVFTPKRTASIQRSRMYKTRLWPIPTRSKKPNYLRPTYAPPSPTQLTIDAHPSFIYAHAADHLPSYFTSTPTDDIFDGLDDAHKPTTDSLLAESSSLASRWLLLEEYASFSLNIPSHVFLTLRSQYNIYPDPIFLTHHGIPPALIPGSANEDWNYATEVVRDLREKFPERTLAAREKKRKIEQEYKMKKWKALTEMEAIAGPLDMTMMVETWASQRSPLLTAKRERAKEQCEGGAETLSILDIGNEKKQQPNKITRYLTKTAGGRDDGVARVDVKKEHATVKNSRSLAGLFEEGVWRVITALPGVGEEGEWNRWLVDPEL